MDWTLAKRLDCLRHQLRTEEEDLLRQKYRRRAELKQLGRNYTMGNIHMEAGEKAQQKRGGYQGAEGYRGRPTGRQRGHAGDAVIHGEDVGTDNKLASNQNARDRQRGNPSRGVTNPNHSRMK